MRLKTFIYSVFTCCAFALAGCNFASINGNTGSNEKKVTGVELDVNYLNLYVEETYQFEATIKPSNATNKTITWSVDKTDVGSISTSGLFTAEHPGQVTVTVTTKDEGYTDTCNVYVSAIPEKVVDHIIATPLKDEYEMNTEIEASDVVVTAYYTNTYYEPEQLYPAYYYLQYDFSEVGEKTVYVTATIKGVDYQTSYTVNVYKPKLSYILVNADNVKGSYTEGEEFDPTGLVVEAYYGSSEVGIPVTGYTITPPDMTYFEPFQRVFVTYEEEGISVNDYFTIGVESNDGVHISEIHTLVANTGGSKSRKFNISGIVTCSYVDSGSKNNAIIQSKDRYGEDGAIVLYNTPTLLEEGSLVSVKGPKSQTKRFNGLPEVVCNSEDVIITSTTTEDTISDTVYTSTEWSGSTAFNTAGWQGTLQIKMNNLTVTNVNTYQATAKFADETEVRIYYGGMSNTTELRAAMEAKLGSKINLRGYLQLYKNDKDETADEQLQLLLKRTTDVEDVDVSDYTINITAFNDFHGAIKENGKRMGLGKVGTYLKQQADKPNTLTLSQGDDWQGSIFSNYNRGRLVNDVYAYAHLSARTVGNHDFDWGLEALKNNTKTGYNGYTTPVLAANVYDFDFSSKTMGTVQQESIGVPSVTYILDNGLKVGIVGIIGKDQITSIMSGYITDIGFKEHIESIKNEATKLRNEGCNAIIATCHTGQENVVGYGLDEYVDLVLCGHTHQSEYTEENGLHYYQFASYGTLLGQITLNYNLDTNKVEFDNVQYISSSNINSYVSSIDSNIANLISTYEANCDEEPDEVLATDVSGNFSSKLEASNLMCKAIYETAVSEGHKDVLLSYCNEARVTLYSGEWTYEKIYEAFPFDNTIYVTSVKGSDILYEVARYNNVYINPGITGDVVIESNKYYKIAVLDYLLYHIDSNHNYNYFKAFDGNPDAQLEKNYRLILRDWLRLQKSGSISSSNFYGSGTAFDRSRIVS